MSSLIEFLKFGSHFPIAKSSAAMRRLKAIELAGSLKVQSRANQFLRTVISLESLVE
jgi:hypothetical protein